MNVRWIVLAGLTALAAVPAARADDVVVRGQVLSVEPLGGAGMECRAAPPRTHAGLVALLRWDLRAGCRQSAGAADGYRVVYRWDGRTYSRVMDERPGDTIPLILHVN